MLNGYESPLYELLTYAFYAFIAVIIIAGVLEIAKLDLFIPQLPGNF